MQVFLVTTLSSAASSAVSDIIEDPMSAAGMLAENLPKASNFYIAYFILQGLTFSSGALLQIVGLILSKVLGKLLDNTPRKQYKRWSTLAGMKWGTVFPVVTNLCVIGMSYSRLHLFSHVANGLFQRLHMPPSPPWSLGSPLSDCICSTSRIDTTCSTSPMWRLIPRAWCILVPSSKRSLVSIF